MKVLFNFTIFKRSVLCCLFGRKQLISQVNNKWIDFLQLCCWVLCFCPWYLLKLRIKIVQQFIFSVVTLWYSLAPIRWELEERIVFSSKHVSTPMYFLWELLEPVFRVLRINGDSDKIANSCHLLRGKIGYIYIRVKCHVNRWNGSQFWALKQTKVFICWFNNSLKISYKEKNRSVATSNKWQQKFLQFPNGKSALMCSWITS